MATSALVALSLLVGCCAAALSPLVVVPGLLGSQLEAKLDRTSVQHSYCDTKSDWYTIWLNLEELAPFVINCFADNIKLVYDKATGNFTNTPGVSIRVPGFGNMSTIAYLDPSLREVGDYFSRFVEEMKKVGYEPGVSMRGAPFDWRQAPKYMPQFYVDLQKLIEDTYTGNKKQKVVLLSHSLGCLQSLYFLTNVVTPDWKAQYISSWIPIAGPWAGTAKIMTSFASGVNEGIAFVDPLSVRAQERSSPSSAWLLPTPSHWNTLPVIITPKRNFTVNQYHDFFEAIGYPFGETMQQLMSNVTQSIPAPGVPVYCVHGLNISTPSRFVYDKDFPNSQPTIVNGNGDGTVNLESLVLCEKWKGKQPQPVNVTVFPDITHFKMVSNDSVINYVKSIVQH